MNASMWKWVVAGVAAAILVGAAVAIGLGTGSSETGSAPLTREEIVAAIPQGYGDVYTRGPAFGTPEWVELNGYTAVRTSGEVARGLDSQPELPNSLGEQACTIVYYGEGESAGEWIVYVFYGDLVLGVHKSAQDVKAVPVDTNRFEHRVSVNGLSGSGWTRGEYDSFAADGKTPTTAVYPFSAVSWSQDGAVLTLSAPSGPFEELLPLAEEVSKQFSFR